MSIEIGEQIKFYRQQRGYTQKKLGELCGMADSAIRRYESGRANPKIETISRIANALELTIEDFLDFSCIEDLKEINDYNGRLDGPEKMNNFLESNLLFSFNNLNNAGKEKAIDQVEMLTKIKEYQKDNDES